MIHRHYLRRLMRAALLLCPLLAATAHAATAAADIIPASNLEKDGARAASGHAVMMLLFSLPGCAPCEEVQRNYLAPLQRDPTYGSRVMVRKVGDIASEKTVVDFSGAPISQRDLAARYHVRVAPTLVFVDPHGKSIADPLVGSGMAGFYGAYLDKSVGAALHHTAPE